MKARSKRTRDPVERQPLDARHAVRAAGLDKLFDMVLSVEDVGIYKPSRRVYRHAMQKLQIQDAPSICFVSANSWDAQAAAQFGFQAVQADAWRRAGRPHSRQSHGADRRAGRIGGAGLGQLRGFFLAMKVGAGQ